MENCKMYKVIINKRTEAKVESLLGRFNSSRLQGILILDVDGTIRSGGHRVHLLPTPQEIIDAGDKPNKAFTRFNEACHLDTKIEPVINMANLMSFNGYYVVVLTSCTHSDHTFKVLMSQLDEWDVHYDAVVMRGEDNQLYPIDFKKQFLYDSGLVNAEVKYAFDDCIINCNMFREEGFCALQVEDYTRFNK